MTTPVNPDKSVGNPLDTPLRANQRISTTQDPQARGSADTRSSAATESRVDVDSARQRYRLETQRAAATEPRITTPQQAKALLGQILEQFSATPQQALQTQSSAGAAIPTRLLERAPV